MMIFRKILNIFQKSKSRQNSAQANTAPSRTPRSFSLQGVLLGTLFVFAVLSLPGMNKNEKNSKIYVNYCHIAFKG